MKRYDHIRQPMKLRDLCEYSDGNYVLFIDAQADKHAALKELAAQALPSVIRDKGSGPGECRCEGCVRRELGLVALIARLQKLTEGPV